MAIRLRKIKGRWVAVCAARSENYPDDIYLDDSMHHALTEKFESDFRKMGFLKEPEMTPRY